MAVNTYEKYRAILKKEAGRKRYNGEAVMGNARSRYVDITRRHEPPVTGEARRLEEEARGLVGGKEKDADDNSIGRKGQDATGSMTKIVIETGNTKIFIYEGKRDPATGVLKKAVTDHA